jgi:hypothetical protein
VTLYGVQATGCRLGWQHAEVFGSLTLQRAAQIFLFLLFVAASAGFVLLLARRTLAGRDQAADRFLHWVASRASIAALGATLFSFAGVFWLTAC